MANRPTEAGFTEAPNTTDKPTLVREPTVSFSRHENTRVGRILQVAYRDMGEPDAIRCYLNDLKLGIRPAEPDEPNAYELVVADANLAQFPTGWIKHELNLDEELEGRTRLEYDDELEMWIADLSKVFGEGPEAELSVDNVLSALSLAGEYLETRERHEPASLVGRAYRQVRDERETLRREDRMNR